MRLLFKKGKQKELLKKEKEKRSLTWNEFAKFLSVKHRKLITFFDEEVLIDDITFNKLFFSKKYKRYIISQLDENWGRKKGGKNSPGNIKDFVVPNKTEELAELWGILLGDGSIQKIKKYRVGIYSIDIAGHSYHDKEYLLNFVKPLCEKLFKTYVRHYYSKHNKCLHITLYGRKLVEFFEENGFKSGNKILNKVTIPTFIKNNQKFLISCLRGLFDTDGSFYRLTNQNNYQIQFENHNIKLLKEVRKSLVTLGIFPSKIMANNSIVITKKSEIEKFYKLIGFNNSKHLNKIKKLF